VTKVHTINQATRQILALAQEIHGLLGAGWSEALYRDALLILCEERLIPFRRAAGVRGAGPVRAAIVCCGSILVRVCDRFVEQRGLRRSLVAAGLERAVLLRFAEQGVISQIVRVDLPVHAVMGDPSPQAYSE
jgi:hypothetical protein